MNYREFSREFVYQKQIELIIVISVIGVLAAIAVPIFSGYRDKALLTHVLGEQGIIKQDLSLYYSINGVWPDDKNELYTFISGLWGKEEEGEGFDSNQSIKTIIIKKGAVHYQLNNHVMGTDKTLTLRPAVSVNNCTGPVIWVCKDERDPSKWAVSGDDRTNVPDRSICRFIK